ncbi:carbonic anhydrase [Candidatus Micrarchaeota archaeon]|nr:carbonic anhydrase [Candidatus Micrarchaeota archaeon]
MDANESLARLREGNSRFMQGKMKGKEAVKRRKELVAGQHPFATIISCSDSRVVPEYIFDADMGEIFIIRTAGNIVGRVSLGSVEYGCAHLHTPILVVLGHEGCGAVKATCECKGECKEGNIKHIVDEVKVAAGAKNYEINASIVENVACVMRKIRRESPIISRLEKDGKLKIMGAQYFLESGQVKFL